MVRIRITGGRYHKEVFDAVDESSSLTLVREPTNSYDSNAIMVLSDGEQVGYVGRASGAKVVSNIELLDKVSNIEQCKIVLSKKYNKYIYAEVIEMNKYSFCIEKMTDEQIRELGEQASNSILSDEAKWCDLAFGGMRHQLAHKEGIKPKVGEICHLERKWKGKEGVNEEHRDPGDKGTVHLVSDETGYSYGVLMQSEKKIKQLKKLGFGMIWNTNKTVRDSELYLNPYTLYKIVQVIDGVFVFVERIGPDEFELATGRHSYERVY